MQAFHEAARLETPGSADLHYNCGVSLKALRRFQEAADAYLNAAQLSPSDGEAWGNLGAALAELGRWKDAAPCQERAMRLAPSVTHALNLAATLYELNRLDEAERVLRDAVVLDPGSAEVKEALATVLTGQDTTRPSRLRARPARRIPMLCRLALSWRRCCRRPGACMKRSA